MQKLLAGFFMKLGGNMKHGFKKKFKIIKNIYPQRSSVQPKSPAYEIGT